jgi:hypothetical protein
MSSAAGTSDDDPAGSAGDPAGSAGGGAGSGSTAAGSPFGAHLASVAVRLMPRDASAPLCAAAHFLRSRAHLLRLSQVAAAAALPVSLPPAPARAPLSF